MNDFVHWIICHGEMRWLDFNDPGVCANYAQCEKCGRIRVNYYCGGMDGGGTTGHHWIRGSKGIPLQFNPVKEARPETDEELLRRIVR